MSRIAFDKAGLRFLSIVAHAAYSGDLTCLKRDGAQVIF